MWNASTFCCTKQQRREVCTNERSRPPLRLPDLSLYPAFHGFRRRCGTICWYSRAESHTVTTFFPSYKYRRIIFMHNAWRMRWGERWQTQTSDFIAMGHKYLLVKRLMTNLACFVLHMCKKLYAWLNTTGECDSTYSSRLNFALFLLLTRYVPNVAERSIWDQCKKYIYWAATYQRPTDRPTSYLGKFQMAISPQGVVRLRSTWCLALRWGFRGRRIEWRYF